MSQSEFNILGRVEVVGPSGWVVLVGTRHRALVGALALCPGVVVPCWRLVEALWGDRPPRTAIRSLHSHVARLRLALDASGLGGLLQTQEPGYLLGIEASTVDARRFEQDSLAARNGLAAGMADWAAGALERALCLWRGDALADAEPTGWTAAEAARLDGLRLAAHADRCEALICIGEYGQALAELERLLVVDPTRERLVGLRMIALCGSGRPTEALESYQRVRVCLAERLGVDPSPELSSLHTALLRGTAPADLKAPGSVNGCRSIVVAPPPRPAQLPAPVGYFTGRAAELAILDNAVPRTGVADWPVVLICGQGGVGKTALAVQWAHSVTPTFPDGQLFVDVRGHDDATALSPADVITALLRCLGVPDDRVPTGLAEQVGLYRSLVAGRRMLIVLDNVGSTDQVVPVIPASASSLLIVTSRGKLAALVTHVPVCPVVIDVLGQDESVQLLARMLGAARVERERNAAGRLAAMCGRLPLALRIAAAKLVMRPTESIADLAADLSEGDRLAQLGVEGGGRSVEAVFTSAYRSLSATARRLFRLLGLHPGPDVGAPLASALYQVPPAQRQHAIGELLAAHLIAEPEPGRYRFHDLLRIFAEQRAVADESAEARETAVERLLDWYLAVADAAVRLLDPNLDRIDIGLSRSVPAAHFPATRDQALAVLESERDNLLPIVRFAADHDRPAVVCQLTYLLTAFFDVRGHWSQRVEMCRYAVESARRLNNPAVEAEMHRALGVAYRSTYQLGPALESHHRALALLKAMGDKRGLALVYNNMGGVNVELRRFEDAVAAYETSLRLHDGCGNLVGMATAQRNLGYVRIRMGRADLSFPHLIEALDTSRANGYHRLEAGTLDSLGEAHLQQGKHREALDCFQQALAVSREIGDRRYEMVALADIGLALLMCGAAAAAVEQLSQALAMCRQMDHRHIEARTLNHLGQAHLRLGNLTEARRCLDASAALRQTLPDPYEQAHLHRNLGDLAEVTGQPAAAEQHFRTAIYLYHTAHAVREAKELAARVPGHG